MNIASYIRASVSLFQTKASTCLIHDLQNDQLLVTIDFCRIIETKGMGLSLITSEFKQTLASIMDVH